MTIDINSIGAALFGPRWKTELANHLRMSDRHMRRIASGTAYLTPSMAEELIEICSQKKAEIEQVDALLSAYIAGNR